MNNKNNFKAAFAEIDITPDFQVELIGCYREDSKSQGILHPLCAQILLLQHNDKNYCLIEVDSLGFTTFLSNKLRKMVASMLHTSASSVMLCFSHTHSAPAPLSPVNGERYFKLVEEHIKKCVSEVKDKLRPCKIGWDMTDTKIGENRREGCTIVDNRLGALKISDYNTNSPIAVVLRLTAHANVLMKCNNKISSDYFHEARKRLQEHFHSPVMLIQGAAGNIKPAGVHKIFGGNINDIHRISDILLSSANKLHFNMTCVESLKMYSKKFEYISDVPSKEESEKIAEEANKLCNINGDKWLKECESLRKAGITEEVHEGEIQFLSINEGCFCGVPDEIFCEISLEASKRMNAPYLFLNGYTNGCAGYLPHGEEWVKGGYETLYSYLDYYEFHGHVMPYRQSTADQIVNLVCSEWKNIYNKNI